MRPGVKIVQDKTKQFAASLASLVETRLLVGYPAAGEGDGANVGPDRRPDDEGLNNATIGYLMNTGMPEQNVPAREHMKAGIMAAKTKLDTRMEKTIDSALSGDAQAAYKGFTAMGLTVQSSIRNVIRAGIPPPLADRTLQDRLNQHPSRKAEAEELAARAAGAQPSMSVIPLINTGDLWNRISFVLRRGKLPRA